MQADVRRLRLAGLGTRNFGFDHKIVRAANHEEMLNVVAPDDHKLALAVHIEDIDDPEPRLPRPPRSRTLNALMELRPEDG
jgi:hypothetical protein